MIRTDEPSYNLRKPPVLLQTRQERFVCEVCKRPGYGPPNSVVHPGKCRIQHTRNIARKSAERKRNRAHIQEQQRAIVAQALGESLG